MTAQTVSLAGYFANFGLLVAWYGWLSPPQLLPRSVVLLLLVSPMLAPLRGMLRGRAYTYAWSCFLALMYFTHGVVEAWSGPELRIYGALEVLFTSLWFTGAIFYVRKPGAMHSDRG